MTITVPFDATDVRSTLIQAVATVLRLSVDQVDDDTSFSALGLDSLAAAELTAEIEDLLGVELPLTAVHEYPTIASLAKFIEGDGDAVSPFERMRADAILPPDITPGLHHHALLTREAKSIILTGATGFLGAHLLRTLLDETSATILCLVRKRAGPSPLARDDKAPVHDNLARYGLGDERDNERIVVVEGDLTRPSLGLTPRAFDALARRTDAIIHSGASVDWVQGYAALRDTNVLGTREVLRLACRGVPKPMHFVSSLGVCYSTLGPRSIGEGEDAMVHLEGLTLGYAQSKCVAESLVREAGARGLPVTIVRPALISGDSKSGLSNVDDLLTRFIAGCIAMGAAPDLDWRVDCLPADQVARAITRLALSHAGGADVVHVAAGQPRQWRECVLWMRLSGYKLDLLPYHDWIRRLARETSTKHPLYPLRSFFLQPVAGELTLPEVYEESRRAHIRDDRSRSRVSALGARCTTIDSALLDRYFDRYVADGIVPAAADRGGKRGAFSAIPSIDQLLPEIARALAKQLHDPSLSIESVALTPIGGDDSIVAELTSWREGAAVGLFRGAVTLGDGQVKRVVVKVKPSDERVLGVAESVAALASPALGSAYTRFRDHIGFTRCHVRELALYRESDPRIRRHSPSPLALSPVDEAERWILVLDEIPASALFHAGETDVQWSAANLRAAIDGAASIHSVWYDREDALMSQSWLAPVRDANRMSEMAPLWSALAEHARIHSPAWCDTGVLRVHEKLCANVAAWAGPLAQLPRTLIHNDFNPRNIAILGGENEAKDPTLCAFDWELATISLPQRDIAELLCWTLDASVTREEVHHWVERARLQLSVAAGKEIAASDWELGIRAALCELLVDRLAMYTMVDRFRPQRYLPRVVRTWMTLQRYYPWP